VVSLAARVMDRDHARIVKLGQFLGLFQVRFDGTAEKSRSEVEELDRDRPLQRGVETPINAPEPSPADLFIEPITTGEDERKGRGFRLRAG
jgi:hypothetical protein